MHSVVAKFCGEMMVYHIMTTKQNRVHIVQMCKCIVLPEFDIVQNKYVIMLKEKMSVP